MMTQQEYDIACDEFKSIINSEVKASGQSSLAMAIALSSGSEILQSLAHFECDVNPQLEEIGIKTKSLSEIFGTEITINVK